MNPASIDIQQFLQDSGIGLVSGDNLFVSFEPPKPIECVTIYDVSGGSPDLAITGETYRRDSVQIRVRGKNFLQCSQKIYNIVSVLQGVHGKVINGTYYSLIKELVPPFFLGYEDNKPIFVANFEVQRRENV